MQKINLVDSLNKVIKDTVPGSEKWTNAVSLATISGVVGNRLEFPSMGGLKLNVWFCNVGISRISYKSLTTAISEQIFRALDQEMPTDFTKEGLTRFISETEKTYGTINYDEITTLFRGEKYMQNNHEFFSRLYSNQGVYKVIASRDKEVIPSGTSFSLLGATNINLYSLLKPQNFHQGVGCRILWMRDTELRNPTKEQLFSSDNITEIDKIIEIFKAFDTELSSLGSPVSIFVDEKIKDQIHEIINDNRTRGYGFYENDPYDLRASYYAEFGTFIIKLASIYALSDMKVIFDGEKVSRVQLNYTMKQNHLDWAIDRVGEYYKDFDIILNEWIKRSSSKKMETEAELHDTLWRQIKQVADRGGYFKPSKIANDLSLNYKRDVKPVLDQWVETGKLVQEFPSRKYYISAIYNG